MKTTNKTQPVASVFVGEGYEFWTPHSEHAKNHHIYCKFDPEPQRTVTRTGAGSKTQHNLGKMISKQHLTLFWWRHNRKELCTILGLGTVHLKKIQRMTVLLMAFAFFLVMHIKQRHNTTDKFTVLEQSDESESDESEILGACSI